MSGLYPSVCFKSEGGVDLRFGSKVSYGLSQMPLQVIFMCGSFKYSNMIGWRLEGRGLNSGPCAESFTIFSPLDGADPLERHRTLRGDRVVST